VAAEAIAAEAPAGAADSQPVAPMKMAFAARLSAVAPEDAGGAPGSAMESPAPGAARDAIPAASRSGAADPLAGPVAARVGSVWRRDDTNSAPAAAANRKEDDGLQGHGARLQESPAFLPDAGSFARPAPALEGGPAAGSSASSPAPQPARETGAGAAAAPEPPRPAAAAHDIKLAVGGNLGHRVEVRVTERHGDVQVAVRTADPRLAGELREDLPALAAKLEQTGYHTETWHPGIANWERLAEPSGGAAPQDGHGGSRRDGGEPRDQQSRNPQDSESPKKDNRKDFPWLFSALQQTAPSGRQEV